MSSKRAILMCSMAQEGKTTTTYEINQMESWLIPKYESTKGTTSAERELALRGWQQLEKEAIAQTIRKNLEIQIESLKIQNEKLLNKNTLQNNRREKSPDTTYNEIIAKDLNKNNLDTGTEAQYVRSTNSNEKLENEMIEISSVEQITDRKNKFESRANKEDTTQNNIMMNEDEDNYSSFSEDKTSGSEYFPSDEDEEIKKKKMFCFHSKKPPKTRAKIKVASNIQIKPPFDTKVKSVKASADSTTDKLGNRSTDDITNSVLQISCAKRSQEGKRIRDKKHSCYFCHAMVLHMARHFEVKHSEEINVARALAYEKKSSKRKEIFQEIIRAGDFLYNCNIISIKQGELILVRRPTKHEILSNSYKDYGPCPHCLGFLLKKHLWQHLKCCSKQANENLSDDPLKANRQIIAESNAILSNVFGFEFSKDYKQFIIDTLRDDEIGNFCREDNLLLKFGAMQFEKYGTTQCELIRQNMRQLARLTLIVRQLTSQNIYLFDLLTPQKFDLIVQGTRELCQHIFNDSTKRPEFMIPSLALKIGHSLKKCASIERGVALREENFRRNESLLAFCNLMELEWQLRISSNALATLYKRKLNAGQLLPLTDDLLKCNKYILEQIQQTQTNLMHSPTAENWKRLANFILCRIILFNKRRSGEASKMTLSQYASRPSWSEQTNQELKSSLSPYEVKLAERHVIVNIIGKRGRIVPVLLTPECKTGIDVLISLRCELIGIHPKNPYVFPTFKQKLTHLRGDAVLRNITKDIELEKPEYITSTKIRKYVATVCQVFDLTENEYDWLARHLGHDIRVHREFYRLHEDTVELTKVSRLLMAVDMGEANKFAGKQLKDITLTELPPIEEEDEDMEKEEEEQEELDDEQEQDASELEQEDRGSEEKTKEDIKIRIPVRKQSKNCASKAVKHNIWNTEDKKAVFQFFKIQIKKGTVPGKKDCEACQEKHPSLKSRKWTDIKFCVKNQITKVSKMKNLKL